MATRNKITVGQVLSNHNIKLDDVDSFAEAIAYKFAYDQAETDDEQLLTIDPALISVLLELLGPLLEKLFERIQEQCDESVSQVSRRFAGRFWISNHLRGQLRPKFNAQHGLHFRSRGARNKAVDTCIEAFYDVAKESDNTASQILGPRLLTRE